MKNMKKSLLAASIMVAAASAQADVTINGFGNVVGGIASSDDVVLNFDDNIDFQNDSLFALQFSSDVSDKITATAQVLSRGEDDFDVAFEWAYLSYEVNNNWTVTAGRSRLPLFAYSASLDVGYTYHWVTAPNAIYNVPFNNLDGVKVSYSNMLGGWDILTDVAAGQFKGDAFGADLRGENTLLVSLQASNESLTVRGVVGRTDATLDLAGSSDEQAALLAGGFSTMRELGLVALSDSLEMEDDEGQFLGASVMWDSYQYFVGAELTKVMIDDSFSNDDTAYYVTAGARYGKWTPSITYERFESELSINNASLINDIAGSGLPDSVAATLTSVALGAQASQVEDYSITSVALRYDLDSGVALKADVSRYNDDVSDDNDGTLARVAVNFVF